jgi:Lon protease-like protein
VAELIPLFPLSHVLLPGMPLPLHVFEPRYHQLLADVDQGARGAGSFGVVALRSGTEAITPHTSSAAALDLETLGTVAEIIEVESNEDGTSDLLSVGSRRFRIIRVVTAGKPYARAEVEFLPEPDGALTPELATRARDLMDVYDTMLMRLAGRGTGPELLDDANQLSYQVAARLPLPPFDRQELLADETTAERLGRIARLLRREIALLQRTRSIAVSPAVLRMITGTN